MRSRRAARAALTWLCALAGLAGCVGPAPIVEHQVFAPPQRALERVAVVPFYPTLRLAGEAEVGDEPAWAAAALVARFVTEALARRGVEVIPASELELAFRGEGQVVPRLDARAAAELAARDFRATSVLLGRVQRYRERSGEAIGSLRPASVMFDVVLHDAPDARQVWRAAFDETQQPLSENVLHARRYPGSGTRWLTAAELARWGAEEMARVLVPGP